MEVAPLTSVNLQVFNILKKVIVIISMIILSSCTKKYDWECRCQIYHDTTSEIKSETIKHVIKPDADRLCAKFGEDSSPPNSAHECTVK